MSLTIPVTAAHRHRHGELFHEPGQDRFTLRVTRRSRSRRTFLIVFSTVEADSGSPEWNTQTPRFFFICAVPLFDLAFIPNHHMAQPMASIDVSCCRRSNSNASP